MLENYFKTLYTKFKIKFYKKVFDKSSVSSSHLNPYETFCIEIIYTLKRPTINEFANFINISSANASYKVNSLIKKGYIKKIKSRYDKREYHLAVTRKYFEHYPVGEFHIKTMLNNTEKKFKSSEIEIINNILTVIYKEMLAELKRI